MMRAARLLAPAILVAGCGLTDPPDRGRDAGIDAQRFIAVYVDLRRAELHSAGGTPFDEAKKAVLERHGTTEEELTRFIDVHGRNARLMATIWDSINTRLLETTPDSIRP